MCSMSSCKFRLKSHWNKLTVRKTINGNSREMHQARGLLLQNVQVFFITANETCSQEMIWQNANMSWFHNDTSGALNQGGFFQDIHTHYNTPKKAPKPRWLLQEHSFIIEHTIVHLWIQSIGKQLFQVQCQVTLNCVCEKWSVA